MMFLLSGRGRANILSFIFVVVTSMDMVEHLFSFIDESDQSQRFAVERIVSIIGKNEAERYFLNKTMPLKLKHSVIKKVRRLPCVHAFD